MRGFGPLNLALMIMGDNDRMNCKWCEYRETEGTKSCLAKHKSGLVCTRQRGHDGEHVACCEKGHAEKVWEK